MLPAGVRVLCCCISRDQTQQQKRPGYDSARGWAIAQIRQFVGEVTSILPRVYRASARRGRWSCPSESRADSQEISSSEHVIGARIGISGIPRSIADERRRLIE